jgi:hypothetical protein
MFGFRVKIRCEKENTVPTNSVVDFNGEWQI